MTPKEEHYQNLADRVMCALEKRQMIGYYCPTKEEAKEKLLSLIEDGATIGYGGSISLQECGITDALKGERYHLLVRESATTPEEQRALYQEMLFADVFLMSANAITEDGELINIDGRGNRVAFLTWGPERVILLVGINKIAPDHETALLRARNTAAPMNAIRLHRDTPCAKTGKCADCQSPDCICSSIVTTRRSHVKGRITVILVGEELGY